MIESTPLISSPKISASPPAASSIASEYGEFIDQLADWAWWVTLTFARSVQPEQAMRHFRIWLRDWHHESAVFTGQAFRREDCGMYGGNAYNRWRFGRGRPQYVVSFEHNKHNAGTHMHALISNPTTFEMNRIIGRDFWHTEHGFCKLEPVRASAAAARYMAKYMSKEGDLVFSDDLENLQEAAF